MPEPGFSPTRPLPAWKTLGAQAGLQRHNPAPCEWVWVGVGGCASCPINHLPPAQPYIPRPKAPTKERLCGQARLGMRAGGVRGGAGAVREGRTVHKFRQMPEVREASDGALPGPREAGRRAWPQCTSPTWRFPATSVFGGAIP